LSRLLSRGGLARREGREGSEGQSQRGEEGRSEWNGKGAKSPVARDGGLYLDICAVVPEFLVTPLLTGPVCVLSHDRFEEPVRPFLLRLFVETFLQFF